jgi:hypothetical protein
LKGKANNEETRMNRLIFWLCGAAGLITEGLDVFCVVSAKEVSLIDHIG